jgi:hypothetical protein
MKSLLIISAGLFLFLCAYTISGQVCPVRAGRVTMGAPVIGAPFSADLVD